MPNRDPEINAIAAAKAREAWAIKPAQKAVRGSLRIPADLASIWEQQDSEDRGLAWAIGCLLTNSGASYIVNSDSVTVILNQHSATGKTQQDAIINLIQSYGYEIPRLNELEQRLAEFDLLE